jgi:hypothetical protein
MNILQLTDNLKTYVNLQLDTMSSTTPIVGFIKPLVTRVLDKNMSKVSKALDLIADNEGNIDVENILTEMIQNVMNTQPFVVNTSFIGDIEVGGGHIKLNVPFTNKRLVLGMADLETFKEMLINKK